MDTLQFDPAIEKDTLCTTIAALEKTWGTPGMAHAFSALCKALARAEQALSALEQENESDTAFDLRSMSWGWAFR